MARLLVLRPPFFRSHARLGLAPLTPRGQHLKRALDDLESAVELPGPGDYEAGIPPVSRAWIRAVPRAGLWVYDTFTEQSVFALLVKDTPPEPLD